MKKFILSISTFILGFSGVICCFNNIRIVESIYTRIGTADTLATYSYTTDGIMLFGVVLFGIVSIVGLLTSIKYSK